MDVLIIIYTTNAGREGQYGLTHSSVCYTPNGVCCSCHNKHANFSVNSTPSLKRALCVDYTFLPQSYSVVIFLKI